MALLCAHRPGTGLGLNISKSIVELHGGQIGYTSSPGSTEFFFSLPLDVMLVKSGSRGDSSSFGAHSSTGARSRLSQNSERKLETIVASPDMPPRELGARNASDASATASPATAAQQTAAAGPMELEPLLARKHNPQAASAHAQLNGSSSALPPPHPSASPPQQYGAAAVAVASPSDSPADSLQRCDSASTLLASVTTPGQTLPLAQQTPTGSGSDALAPTPLVRTQTFTGSTVEGDSFCISFHEEPDSRLARDHGDDPTARVFNQHQHPQLQAATPPPPPTPVLPAAQVAPAASFSSTSTSSSSSSSLAAVRSYASMHGSSNNSQSSRSRSGQGGRAHKSRHLGVAIPSVAIGHSSAQNLTASVKPSSASLAAGGPASASASGSSSGPGSAGVALTGAPNSAAAANSDANIQMTSLRPPTRPGGNGGGNTNAGSLAQSLAGSRVLVVEDSVPNRKLLQSLLVHMGCKSFGVENGQECVDLFKVSRNMNSDGRERPQAQRALSAGGISSWCCCTGTLDSDPHAAVCLFVS